MAIASKGILFRVKAFLLKQFFFGTEQRLLRGKTVSSRNDPSFVFFTVHKAASSLLSMRLGPVFRENGYTVADLSSYFAKTGIEKRTAFINDPAALQKVFSQKGVFHVAFRFPIAIPCFKELKILLVLRDPRDVLVSHYFSTRYSHPVMNAEISALKDKAEEMSIDDYVINLAPVFKKRFEDYRSWIGQPNVLFWKYEDLIEAPSRFEAEFKTFSGIKFSEGSIVSAADFVQEKEDPFSHKRFVHAGDHRNKLKQETIAFLTDEFREVLEKLEYQTG